MRNFSEVVDEIVIGLFGKKILCGEITLSEIDRWEYSLSFLHSFLHILDSVKRRSRKRFFKDHAEPSVTRTEINNVINVQNPRLPAHAIKLRVRSLNRFRMEPHPRLIARVNGTPPGLMIPIRPEIGVAENLWSDGFMLPHEMGVLFYKGECVGFSAFTHGNMLRGPLSDHSWWKAWTPDALEQLRKISSDAIICSQFTVNPEFAGKGHFVRWKEIVFLYTFMRFENSDAGVMAGHLNLTRGMQNACGETFGATVLNPCHPFSYFGVEINAQIVAYERHNIRLMQEKKGITGLCEDLWSRLVHLTEFPAEKKIHTLRRAA